MASIIKKPGSKFYHAIYRDHQGKQCCRSTKEVNDRRARRIADLFEKAAKKTTSPHRIRRAFNELLEELNPDHAPAVTVREKFEGWLRVKRPALAESTFAAYRKTADRFLGFLGERADEDIAAIDKRTIADFRDGLELSPGTVNNHLKEV